MTKVECVLDARAGIGEGPLWCAHSQVLWWVEILERRLHRFDPASGEDQIFDTPSFIGSVALRRSGGLVAALQEGFSAFDPASGVFDLIAPHPLGEIERRFNDGVATPEGRFLATTMMAQPPFDAPDQALFALNTDLSIHPVETGLQIGNGLAFSPDGKTLYLSDSHPDRSCVWAYDWRADEGWADNRRLFFDGRGLLGHPDGAAVDADGCYWFAAAYGWSVVRLTPQGVVDRVVEVPVQKPTKVAFGGPRLDTLYITSIGTNLEPGSAARQPFAGGVFAFSPGVSGLPVAKFAG